MEEKENQIEDKKQDKLEGGTYEIIRNRLLKGGRELQNRLNELNITRKEVFGSIETKLIANERITTDHNCIPADMVSIDDFFIFGYNVHMGLKTEISPADVFCCYRYGENKFKNIGIEILENESFKVDFDNVYKYYKQTQFSRFLMLGIHLYLIFRVGKSVNDIKAFKWIIKENTIDYIDNRSEHEIVIPDQHEFVWKRTKREQHRYGKHPHISIEDKVFVETTEGDLTIKVENNTDSGEGILAEPVDDPDQTLDDAEFYYAILGNLIVLKIRPYQEKKYRYFVFNHKLKEARRIDSLEASCVLLPDHQGIIFANGYYLQTGDYKIFENDIQNMIFEKKLASPNGEDFLYTFFNRNTGDYILLFYNIIEQSVQTPIICRGYSIFDNGEMCYFRDNGEAQRHHSIQVWQTPYLGHNFEIEAKTDSYLFKIGNKDIVKAMAECHELITLVNKEDSYSGLYLDLVKLSTDIVDTYYWLGEADTANLKEPLLAVKESATAAIDEFDKVTRIKKNTKDEVERVTSAADKVIKKSQSTIFENIDDFVKLLSALRTARGEIISLKELRYVDLQLVENYDQQLAGFADDISSKCINFLDNEEALLPYSNKVDQVRTEIEAISKVIDANRMEDNINDMSAELEMLIEIVSGLKIEDATQTAKIIDNISTIYSSFNQIRAALKRKRQKLILVEGKAEFNAQIKLIGQSVINYIDLCDIPEKTDEYLSKLMVQLEELEGKFSDFNEFIELISEKREEIYNAFESRKMQLIEERNRRADSLLQSANRILKAIQNRVSRYETVNEINGYYASDLMIEKVRDTIDKLMKLGDTVKADDIQSRLKSVRDDAVRQLKDRQELFVAGDNIISFGKHQFTVNTQALGLTMVMRGEEMNYHLTGTGLFELVEDDVFNSTKSVWSQSLISENDDVYRSEYLAYKVLTENELVEIVNKKGEHLQKNITEIDESQLFDQLKKNMAQRYNEGYIKGVHDYDAFNILKELLNLQAKADLLIYPSHSRACAEVFWSTFIDEERKDLIDKQIKGAGKIREIFKSNKEFVVTKNNIRKDIEQFIETYKLFDNDVVEDATDYLFEELSRGNTFVMHNEALKLHDTFLNYLRHSMVENEYLMTVDVLQNNPKAQFILIRNWVSAFVAQGKGSVQLTTVVGQEKDIDALSHRYIDEVAATLFAKSLQNKNIVDANLTITVEGMQGTHSQINNEEYLLDYNQFRSRLRKYEQTVVPLYHNFVHTKNQLLKNYENELRLNEFKPKVLTSFVRNKLLDQVYLPLIGGNLAKQIGAAGAAKRTDLMGMLLLISPPGYGKTTLMEYIANRLGIVFMKINGPAIGHSVIAIDPAEAPNATAREELKKLNLAFEMGDNVMIYLDDIQHCNPEFLQKFISMSDAQRKIEGVYKGRTKTYDFRGKKVCIIMAGNPYTESGDKFQIPDMLANRADIYNLGDIIGGADDVFILSYIENSMTSNSILSRLSSKSHDDLHILLKVIETGSQEGLEFEASHSPEEISEYLSILRKMLTVRDIVLKVNMQYIYSAAQAEEYRIEPAFKLQGSYRNMNKLVEKIMPIMNDKELKTMILSHYENESQTLTTGAEANLLKFKDMVGWINEKEAERWTQIKETFQKQQKLKGMGSNQQIANVLMQLETMSEGVNGIKDVLAKR